MALRGLVDRQLLVEPRPEPLVEHATEAAYELLLALHVLEMERPAGLASVRDGSFTIVIGSRDMA